MGLSEPKELNYLNFDKSSLKVSHRGFDHQPYFSVMISLSNEVTVQKRIVYDMFMLFGDIGGLRDFLALILASVFGLFSEHLKTADLISRLFRVSIVSSSDSKA